MISMTYELSSNDYRVALPSKSYPSNTKIIMQSFKSIMYGLTGHNYRKALFLKKILTGIIFCATKRI